MKRWLMASAASALMIGAASAADLPRRVAPPPVFVPIPVFTWTGFYAGLHSAYAFSDKQTVHTSGYNGSPSTGCPPNCETAAARTALASVYSPYGPTSVKSEQNGFANVGGGFGVNYQLTPGSGFVVGAAFDISWTDLHKNTVLINNPNTYYRTGSVYSQSLDYLGTVNGKIGYAFDRFLVYGTGGLAFGNVGYGASFYSAGGSLQYLGGYDVNFETGYNYGGGVEYAIPEDSFLSSFAFGKLLGIQSAVTIKAEYIRYDLGSRSVLVDSAPYAGYGSYISKFHTEGSIVRAGFNYKFGG